MSLYVYTRLFAQLWRLWARWLSLCGGVSTHRPPLFPRLSCLARWTRVVLPAVRAPVSILACLISAARPTSGIEEPTQLVTRTRRSSEFASCCGGVRTCSARRRGCHSGNECIQRSGNPLLRSIGYKASHWSGTSLATLSQPPVFWTLCHTGPSPARRSPDNTWWSWTDIPETLAHTLATL